MPLEQFFIENSKKKMKTVYIEIPKSLGLDSNIH